MEMRCAWSLMMVSHIVGYKSHHAGQTFVTSSLPAGRQEDFSPIPPNTIQSSATDAALNSVARGAHEIFAKAHYLKARALHQA